MTAKKKGATLSDLNEFLKQEPKSLADVEKLDTAESAFTGNSSLAELIRVSAAEQKSSETLALLNLIRNFLEEQEETTISMEILYNTVRHLLYTEKLRSKLNEIGGE